MAKWVWMTSHVSGLFTEWIDKDWTIWSNLSQWRHTTATHQQRWAATLKEGASTGTNSWRWQPVNLAMYKIHFITLTPQISSSFSFSSSLYYIKTFAYSSHTHTQHGHIVNSNLLAQSPRPSSSGSSSRGRVESSLSLYSLLSFPLFILIKYWATLRYAAGEGRICYKGRGPFFFFFIIIQIVNDECEYRTRIFLHFRSLKPSSSPIWCKKRIVSYRRE